eukprot:11167810-Lingulodinium_polyedra.AAC.1
MHHAPCTMHHAPCATRCAPYAVRPQERRVHPRADLLLGTLLNSALGQPELPKLNETTPSTEKK